MAKNNFVPFTVEALQARLHAGPHAFQQGLPRSHGAADPGPALQPSCHHTSKPTLELDRDGDHITRIRIRCACGEVIVLDCEK